MAELTEVELKYLQAVKKHGSKRAAAKALNCSEATIRHALQRAAFKGHTVDYDYSEHIPEGIHLDRFSKRVLDENGNVIWLKGKADKDAQVLQSMQSVLEDWKPPKLPAAPKVKKASVSNVDLMNLSVITDLHMGMYAWGEECGSDYDLNTAESLLIKCIHDMLARSPSTECATLCLLGDFLHWDGIDAVTPSSKHLLDVDTRFRKLQHLALNVTQLSIHLMLTKYERVNLIVCEGNHDPASTGWIQAFAAINFKQWDRVNVEQHNSVYHASMWGDNMLGYHHGHCKKIKDLPALFSSDPRFRPLWGAAKHTHLHSGHLHHEKTLDDNGARAEQHPTLAARDAHSARGGYVAQRAANCITYDKTFGEVTRIRTTPEMLGI